MMAHARPFCLLLIDLVDDYIACFGDPIFTGGLRLTLLNRHYHGFYHLTHLVLLRLQTLLLFEDS